MSIWQVGRWWTIGIVAMYLAVSLGCGRFPWARSCFWTLVAAWTLVVVVGAPNAAAGIGNGHRIRFVELFGFNCALSMLLAEGGLRAWAAYTGASPLLSDCLEAYKLHPGQEYGHGVRGNRQGFPGRDFVIDKRPGTVRVAVLGDSFAVGPAIPYAQNFLCLTEAALKQVEIENFGISGTGPREYLEVLRRHAWRYCPDFVVVCVFVGNDITETLATPRHLDPRTSYLYALAMRLMRWEASHPVPQQAPPPPGGKTFSDQAFAEIEARRAAICRYPVPAAIEKKWRRALTYLEMLAEECQVRSTPMAVVLIPDEFQVNPAVLDQALHVNQWAASDVEIDMPQRRLRRFFEGLRVPCLDLLPAFQGQADTYAPNDTHWNEKGNWLAAREMTRWLAQFIRSHERRALRVTEDSPLAALR